MTKIERCDDDGIPDDEEDDNAKERRRTSRRKVEDEEYSTYVQDYEGLWRQDLETATLRRGACP